jgi:hypothetical protein
MKLRTIRFALLIGALFSMIACNDGTFPDPCDSKDCANGGDCVEGECVCSDGWTGARCDEEVKPVSMRLISVFLSQFPDFNINNNPWDRDTTGPDVYITLSEAVGAQLEQRYVSWVFKDVNSDSLYFELDSLNVLMGDPSAPHALILTDQDDTTTQNMSQIGFTPYRSGTSFEDTMYVESLDMKTRARLVFEYGW